MTIRVKVFARGHGDTTDRELATINDWDRELFASDRKLIEAFSWQDKRGMGFNIQTYLDQEFVGFAHVFLRKAEADETPVLIGGLGGVMTATRYQGRGIAARTVAKANQIILRNFGADLGLLLCKPALTGFYQKQKWQKMSGQVLLRQESITMPWPQSCMLLLPQDATAPSSIDLCGPPF